MFTGLVEALGTVVAVAPRRGSTRLSVQVPFPPGELRPGESLCVDGACLTVSALRDDRFEADVVSETLSRTTLKRLRPGSRVHLERALRLGDRVGGHLVQGHVDGTGKVVRVERRGDDVRLYVAYPAPLRRYLAEKGSVAIDGVSLTVAAIGRHRLEVALVPETLARTNLGRLSPGDEVNLEADLLARYLESLMVSGGGTGGGRGARGPAAGRRTRS